MRRMIIILLFLGIAQFLVAQQQGNERFVKIINRLVEAMNNQDYEGIVREYDKGMSVNFPLLKPLIFLRTILAPLEK